MSIFSFENGHIVPAQPVDLSVSRLGSEMLTALRARVLELIDEPLFPIAWTSDSVVTDGRERLLALDPSGQIVTIDVLSRLSGEELISVLGVAGRNSEISAETLTSLKGVTRTEFDREWEAFVDMCPPIPHPGPRLYLIVLAVEDEVRSVIEALAGAAVSVRLASVISSGAQVFITVDEIRSRTTALSSLLEASRMRAQVTSAPIPVPNTVIQEEKVSSAPVPPVTIPPQQSIHSGVVSGNAPVVNAQPVQPAQPAQPTARVDERTPSVPFPASVSVSLHADNSSQTVSADSGSSVDDEFVEETVMVKKEQVEEETTPVRPSRRALRMAEREAARNSAQLGDDRSVHSFEAVASQQSSTHSDQSQLTLSTFDIASRPPSPAQASHPSAPTVPAPESALSVPSAVSTQSAQSADAAISAGIDDATSGRQNTEIRAKAIFASLPRIFSKSAAEKRRTEQLLWDQAAPARDGRTQARIFSESTADSSSSDAVSQAAKNDSF